MTSLMTISPVILIFAPFCAHYRPGALEIGDFCRLHTGPQTISWIQSFVRGKDEQDNTGFYLCLPFLSLSGGDAGGWLLHQPGGQGPENRPHPLEPGGLCHLYDIRRRLSRPPPLPGPAPAAGGGERSAGGYHKKEKSTPGTV